jgi:hypothetical protein
VVVFLIQPRKIKIPTFICLKLFIESLLCARHCPGSLTASRNLAKISVLVALPLWGREAYLKWLRLL